MSAVTLSDLPVEIIQRILAEMDTESILILGEVNRHFNHLALEAFFGTMKGGTRLEKFPPPLGHPIELLYRGLRIAIGIEQITTVELSIHDFLEGAHHQVQMLISCIGRLQYLKTFKLWIRIDPQPAHPRGCKILSPFTDSIAEIWGQRDKIGDLLISELQRLMDIVVSKGCQNITIASPCLCHFPPSRLSSSQVRAVLRKNTLTAASWRWAKSFALSSVSSNPHPLTNTRRPKLKDCTLRGLVFLGPTALTFNLDLLKRSASSVQRVDLHTEGLTQSSMKLEALVSGLLNDIHLPNLRYFILVTNTCLIQGSYLTWFLSRHPNLVGINIANAAYPTTQFSNPFNTRNSPLIRRPIHLSKLCYFKCPAHIAEWLLKQPLEVSPTLRTVYLNAHGRRVHLLYLGSTICELRGREISQIDLLVLGAEWWKYAWNVSRQKDLELFGSHELPKLKIVKLELVLSPPPTSCLGTSTMVLAEAFVHLIKHTFSVEEVEIRPGVPGEYISLNRRDIICAVRGAFPDLRSVQCNC